MNILKVCGRCKIPKPLDRFYIDPKKKEGRSYSCKACVEEYQSLRPLYPVSVDVKTCNTCKESKSASSFYRMGKSKDGLRHYCKECSFLKNKKYRTPDLQRNFHLMRFFKIGLKEWNEMFEAQGKQCKICAARTSKGHGHGFYIDHDHNTRKIRGILCHSCNALLGFSKDSPEILTAAIKYLHESNTE